MNNGIVEQFKMLGIHEQDWPNYLDPYDFARQIDRCALTVNVMITTSNSCLSNVEPADYITRK